MANSPAFNLKGSLTDLLSQNRNDPESTTIISLLPVVSTNPQINQSVKNSVEGLDSYDHRGIAATRVDNNHIVLLSEKPEIDVFEYNEAYGIGPSRNNIFIVKAGPKTFTTHSQRIMENSELLESFVDFLKTKNIKSALLFPFIALEHDQEFARYLTSKGISTSLLSGNPEAVRHFNYKHIAKRLAMSSEVGIPVVEGTNIKLLMGANGYPVDTASLEAEIRKFLDQGKKSFVRGSEGTSSSSTYSINGEADLQLSLKRIKQEDPNEHYLVEEMIDVLDSPNTQLWIDDRTIHFLGISDQVLCGTVYEGNILPSISYYKDDIIKYSELFAKALWKEGIRGPIGMDYIISQEGKVYFCEVNIRITGCGFPLALKENLVGKEHQGVMCSLNIETPFDNIMELHQALQENKMEYSLSKKSGVYIFNTGLLKLGKATLLVVEDSYRELRARLIKLAKSDFIKIKGTISQLINRLEN